MPLMCSQGLTLAQASAKFQRGLIERALTAQQGNWAAAARPGAGSRQSAPPRKATGPLTPIFGFLVLGAATVLLVLRPEWAPKIPDGRATPASTPS